MLDHILEQLNKPQWLDTPFQAFVLEDFIPSEKYAQLRKSLPQHKEFIHSVELLELNHSILREYLNSIHNIHFFNSLLQIFEQSLELNASDLGLRKRDHETPYVSEAYIVKRDPHDNEFMNSRSNPLQWLLPPHRDSEHTILSMVHYFPENENSQDYGDFYALKPHSQYRKMDSQQTIEYAFPQDFDILAAVPVKPNTLVALLCDEKSWHAIGSGSKIRQSINISLERQNDGVRRK